MKVLVVSDTHGKHANLWNILDEVGKIDMLLHLGDVCGGEDEIALLADCPCQFVAGNNDMFSWLDREKELMIGGQRIYMTHGYGYYGSAMEHLKKEAARRLADVVLFGHTHVPYLKEENGVWYVNPGSVSYPRQEGRNPSYIVMETAPKGGVSFDLRYL